MHTFCIYAYVHICAVRSEQNFKNSLSFSFALPVRFLLTSLKTEIQSFFSRINANFRVTLVVQFTKLLVQF